MRNWLPNFSKCLSKSGRWRKDKATGFWRQAIKLHFQASFALAFNPALEQSEKRTYKSNYRFLPAVLEEYTVSETINSQSTIALLPSSSQSARRCINLLTPENEN